MHAVASEVRWSGDRPGRNYEGVCDVIRQFMLDDRFHESCHKGIQLDSLDSCIGRVRPN